MAALQQLACLEGHSDRVWCAAWSPDGRELATSGGDRSVRVWGEEAGRWVCKLRLDDVQTRTVRWLDWSPCGRYLAGASFDATTTIWQRAGGDFELVTTLEGHENEVKGVAWSSGGDLLATCARDKTVWIWERDQEEDEYECAAVLSGHSQDVKCVRWHPSERLLASASYDDTVRLWVAFDDDWICAQTLEAHASTVWSIAFSPAGDKLASVSDDRALVVWSRTDKPTPDGRLDRAWARACTVPALHARTIFSVDWSPDGVLATGGADDAVWLLELRDAPATGEVHSELLLQQPKAHDGDVNCVRWNPRRPDLLATVGDDFLVRVWQLRREA